MLSILIPLLSAGAIALSPGATDAVVYTTARAHAVGALRDLDADRPFLGAEFVPCGLVICSSVSRWAAS